MVLWKQLGVNKNLESWDHFGSGKSNSSTDFERTFILWPFFSQFKGSYGLVKLAYNKDDNVEYVSLQFN